MSVLRPLRHMAPASRGFSLIELMVSLTLGLGIVVAISLVFLGSRQASRSTDGLSRMQESARTVFELMARELREAGGTPCDNRPTVANVLNGFQTAPPAWWSDWSVALQGFEGNTAASGVVIGGATGERVNGTDAVTLKFVTDLSDLVVVSHDTANAVFTVNNSPHRVSAGDVVMACTYNQGAIFEASSVAASTISHATGIGASDNCSKGLGLATVCTSTGTTYAFKPGSRIGRLVAATWYVGNNGRVATGGRSLFRVSRAGVEEVAEGVQNMQLSYLTTGGAAYVNAAAVANWSDVVAIRVVLTLASGDTGVSTSADSRLQRDMTFTLNLRNHQS